MLLIDMQLSASEVLRTFHQDEPTLFLGSAFTTVGLVTVAFCLLRRRFDALLVWLGVFAFLYGQRMWFDTGLLNITLGETNSSRAYAGWWASSYQFQRSCSYRRPGCSPSAESWSQPFFRPCS